MKETVLLVEDNEDHAELITRSLAEKGIGKEIYRVDNGEKAILYLKGKGEYANRELPKVVILDINLPKVSGHEVLRFMRGEEALKDIPVTILSTSDAQKDRELAQELGVDNYIIKPFDFGDFSKVMVGVLEKIR